MCSPVSPLTHDLRYALRSLRYKIREMNPRIL